MEFRQLGQTDLSVSLICLGTMTWGEQNTEAEAHDQIDQALAAGVNFLDTAEMYPVPPKPATQGLTESYIGNWLQTSGKRTEVVLATKIVGRTVMDWFRDGKPCLDRKNIETALNESLKRLKTDYIDLYQIHWPDRSTNFFGQLGYQHQDEPYTIAIEETLTVLQDLIKTGKIRHIGISNESPWGAMRFIAAAEHLGLPRIVSIQNPYNLLNRTYEIGLSEISHRERAGLLAYSPLGFGVLSGKYLNGKRPENCRLTLFERFQRYTVASAQAAISDYVSLARKHGLDPAQMALSYVNSRPFVTANIIGATNREQLTANLASVDLKLPDEVIQAIDKIHAQHPNPCP